MLLLNFIIYYLNNKEYSDIIIIYQYQLILIWKYILVLYLISLCRFCFYIDFWNPTIKTVSIWSNFYFIKNIFRDFIIFCTIFYLKCLVYNNFFKSFLLILILSLSIFNISLLLIEKFISSSLDSISLLILFFSYLSF